MTCLHSNKDSTCQENTDDSFMRPHDLGLTIRGTRAAAIGVPAGHGAGGQVSWISRAPPRVRSISQEAIRGAAPSLKAARTR